MLLVSGFLDPRAWTIAFGACLPVTLLGIAAMAIARRRGRATPARRKGHR